MGATAGVKPSAPEAQDAKLCSTLAGYWLDGWVAPEPIAQRLKAGRFGLECILGFMAFMVLLFRAGVFEFVCSSLSDVGQHSGLEAVPKSSEKPRESWQQEIVFRV